jgi:hypothetical protein
MMRAMKVFGTLALLLAVGGLAQADNTKGTIKMVDSARNAVVLKGVLNDSTYELAKDATVWLDGKRAKIGDLAADDRAAIIYEKKGDRLVASQVRGLRRAEEATGTVNDIFGDKREVTLKGVVKNTTYELTKEATVHIEGKAAALAGIQAGDEVLVTYEKRGDHFMANDVTVLKRK